MAEDFRDLERDFRARLEPLGFTVERLEDTDYSLDLVVKRPESAAVIGRFQADPTDLFFLTLDNGARFSDTEWEEEGQLEVARSFAEIVTSHVADAGSTVIERSWLSGRKGQAYCFTILGRNWRGYWH